MAGLSFQGGTLLLDGLERSSLERGDEAPPERLRWDPRAAVHRAPAVDYAELVRWARRAGVPLDDQARAYGELALRPVSARAPYPHQREALAAWLGAGGRGVVVLPTGAGKTQVAMMAMTARPRSTLVVVPTIDLLNQWFDVLSMTFRSELGESEIGIVGGGYHDVRDITVITYDSAHLTMDRIGARFGLVVFDECHHLPSEAYATAARMCLAPFRLGLSATPERADGLDALYPELVGPVVYRKDIGELAGEYLAPYETVRVQVPLAPDERAAYDEARGEYLSFVKRHGIKMGAPDGWARFLQRSSASNEGRRAFAAYRRQRMLALCAPGKLDVLEGILRTHRADRAIVFTEDNATVYEISRRLLLPAITHQTKVKERSAILGGLHGGTFGAIVTSKVLNEGVDVKAANVAVVLSGSGSVREHVQRLGRILRKDGDKQAVLYELVAAGTAEEGVSNRRREHVAYR
jgi:superfamily II DNA or RNA helicase